MLMRHFSGIFLPNVSSNLRPFGLNVHRKQWRAMAKGSSILLSRLLGDSLEGALMISSLQRTLEALPSVQSHLSGFLENEVATTQ